MHTSSDKPSMDAQLQTCIEENFPDATVEIVNNSHLHLGHAGDDGSGQTHYQIRIFNPQWGNLSRLQRQREVMEFLKPLFDNGLHAVQLKCDATKV